MSASMLKWWWITNPGLWSHHLCKLSFQCAWDTSKRTLESEILNHYLGEFQMMNLMTDNLKVVQSLKVKLDVFQWVWTSSSGTPTLNSSDRVWGTLSNRLKANHFLPEVISCQILSSSVLSSLSWLGVKCLRHVVWKLFLKHQSSWPLCLWLALSGHYRLKTKPFYFYFFLWLLQSGQE